MEKVEAGQRQFKLAQALPNLGMQFIPYAKTQSTEMMRDIISMNRSKEIQVKCKEV